MCERSGHSVVVRHVLVMQCVKIVGEMNKFAFLEGASVLWDQSLLTKYQHKNIFFHVSRITQYKSKKIGDITGAFPWLQTQVDEVGGSHI